MCTQHIEQGSHDHACAGWGTVSCAGIRYRPIYRIHLLENVEVVRFLGAMFAAVSTVAAVVWAV